MKYSRTNGEKVGYRLPIFADLVKIYTNGVSPPAPPRLTVMGNLALGRRTYTGELVTSTATAGVPVVPLLLPAYTDVRGANSAGGSDLIIVGAAQLKRYNVLWVEDIAEGFLNLHRMAMIRQQTPFVLAGGPTPPPGPGIWIPPLLRQAPARPKKARPKKRRQIAAILAGGGPPAGPFVVQSNFGNQTPDAITGDWTATYTSPTVAGNFLLVVVLNPTAFPVSIPPDMPSFAPTSFGAYKLTLYTQYNVGVTSSFACTSTLGGGDVAWAVVEFGNMPAFGGSDALGGNTGLGTALSVAPIGATTAANDICFCVAGTDNPALAANPVISGGGYATIGGSSRLAIGWQMIPTVGAAPSMTGATSLAVAWGVEICTLFTD